MSDFYFLSWLSCIVLQIFLSECVFIFGLGKKVMWKQEKGEAQESERWYGGGRAVTLPEASFAAHLPRRPPPAPPAGRGRPRGACRLLVSAAPGPPQSPAAGHCTRRETPAQDRSSQEPLFMERLLCSRHRVQHFTGITLKNSHHNIVKWMYLPKQRRREADNLPVVTQIGSGCAWI